MQQQVLVKFERYFADLTQTVPDMLGEFYSDEIVFTDPIHHIKGIEALKTYFEKLNSNLLAGEINFYDKLVQEKTAYLSWDMLLSLKKPRKNIHVSGVTRLSFEEKIVFQRDYYDLGALIYEHIPFMGLVIRMLKKRFTL